MVWNYYFLFYGKNWDQPGDTVSVRDNFNVSFDIPKRVILYNINALWCGTTIFCFMERTGTNQVILFHRI